jgi:hypothetical protein
MGDRISLVACMPNITTNMAARVTSDMTMGGTVALEFTDLLLSDLEFL